MDTNHDWFTNHTSPVEADAALTAAEQLDEQLREMANGQRKANRLSLNDLTVVLAYVRQQTQVK